MEKLIQYSEYKLTTEGKLQHYYDKVKDLSEFNLLRQLIIMRRKNKDDRFERLLFGLLKDKYGLTGNDIEDEVINLAQHI